MARRGLSGAKTGAGHFAYAEFGDVGALDRRASDTASSDSGTAAVQQNRSTAALAEGARFC